MNDEYGALIKIGTWNLVPRPLGANVFRSIWLFKHKYNADGSLARYKAHLVANGKSQKARVDFDETFSPFVKPATIRTVLKVGLAKNWMIHQLDVKNAFLQGNIDEKIYIHQPPDFQDANAPNHVCKLNKALYELKQAPRAWNARFASFITNLGFVQSKSDMSLFVYRNKEDLAYLLLYVGDIMLTASSTHLIQSITTSLKQEFPMTDLGVLHFFFLGVAATFNEDRLFCLNQNMLQTSLSGLEWRSASHVLPLLTSKQSYENQRALR